MIPISRLDYDLSIFRKNKVIVYGTHAKVVQMLMMLDINDIDISYIYIEGSFDRSNISGIKVISQDEVVRLCNSSDDIIVQLSDPDTTVASTNLAYDKVITHNETVGVILFIEKLKERVVFPELVEFFQTGGSNKISPKKQKARDNILNSVRNPTVLICTPTRTGTNTLMKTFAQIGQPFHKLYHNPELFLKDELSHKDITYKIITVVREPISLDISDMYHELENLVFSPMLSALNIHENTPHFMTGGGNAQEVFDLVFDTDKYEHSYLEFLLSFKANILDLLSFPFDKEHGYSIIKEGNIEVFVYQFEKLEALTQVLGDWLSTPIEQFLVENDSDGSWVADSYKLAKDTIEFSQSYLDNSYSNEWVEHFYSSEDIEKLKSNWQSHIKK